MNLTSRAMGASRLTLFAALLILLAGVATFLSFPSQEEPSVTVRDALVSVSLDGLSAERSEELLARPLEERIRELAEIKNVLTTVQPGRVIVQVTAYDNVKDLGLLWQRLRAKVSETSGGFPPGTQGPFVDDDFGRVAVASVALTAPGFTMSEMRGPIKRLRNQLYALKGVDQVQIYGLQDERIYLDVEHQTLAAAGLSPQQLLQQLQARNLIATGGNPVIGQQSTTLSISGEVLSLEQLRQFPVQLPNGQKVALQNLSRVSVSPVDPPETEAIYQGQDAVVLAVSMQPGLNVQTFGNALRKRLGELEQQLPTGFTLHVVTFQSSVVEHEMSKMYHVMAETVVIVMCVVMLFLGWRTGLVVGVIVPLTILSTLLVMRALWACWWTTALSSPKTSSDACMRARIDEVPVRGRATLMIPLLTSSLVIVLAFSPFFLGQTSTNEYLRSLAVVLATTLISSWLLSVTVTPLLCFYFARMPAVKASADEADEYASVFYRGYRKVIEGLLNHSLIFIACMMGLLALAVVVLTRVPYDFLPKSDRMQFQIPLVLEPGSSSRDTSRAVRDISQWLSSDQDVEHSIGYVASGGPRIVLGLNPPLPAPNIAYFTVSVREGANLDAVIERARQFVLTQHPEIEAQPKRFSMGTTEAGIAVYRVIGPDEEVLRGIARQIEQALSALPGTLDVHDDWRTRLLRYDVVVDPYKALQAGVATQDIAQALQLRNSGLSVSSLQDGDTAVAIVAREQSTLSKPGNDLDSTLIYPASGGAPLMLSAIATVEPRAEASTLQRRNLQRAITVVGHNPSMTATSIVEQLAPQIAAISLPAGYHIEPGGEIEDSAEANQALLQYMPHALVAMLLLFVWQFNSFRKLLIVISSVPFVLIGVALALVLTGYPFGFMATFGLLSLAGIIVNNAVLLLERIEAEREHGLAVRDAVVNAAIKRLRPIVMTKLTCIIGLVPLMLFAGPLWEGMAITIMGGLALGTLVTLGLIPILYALLFDRFERWRKAS
ncbi:Cation/multidrug efflux pump [Pseudomonas syringae pv. syringae HS191]|uniref:efflux RND transporter permease subunit n=1 Tax=Pseudomonas syringae TaxID=317 RepID=UPI0006243A41|nr:efflux RND transporter permease subunit [Pseudomonas syringae]AKF51024.1 Cation/multidrug efflux pump [Pseudomonas syringae pv. syringae HS191]